ncbi:MAG TPA: ABC transporter ATP-binding protein [Patescibacteria group bacterium]|nr:ABC transporter ATP-binding protein [Patescibacteria group bacterium]
MEKESMLQIIKNSIRLILRLFKFSKGCRISYIISLIINACTMARYNLLIGISIQKVTDYSLNREWDKLKDFLPLFIIAFVINTILTVLESYLLDTRLAIIKAQIQENLLEGFMRLPMSYYNNNHTGDLQSRLTSDLAATSSAMSFFLISPMNFLSYGMVSIIMIAYINLEIALICTILVISALLVNSVFLKPIHRSSRKIQKSLGKATACYSDIVSGISIIKIFNLQDWAIHKFKVENDKILFFGQKLNLIDSTQHSTNGFIDSICTFGVLGISALFLADGKISVGSLLAITKYAGILIFAFTGVGRVTTRILRCLAGAERALEIIDGPTEEDIKATKHYDASSNEVLVFDNISFQYDDSMQIISGITEKITKGETIALVGPSGVGKSTIMKILMGFYNLEEGNGSILLYGKPLNTYTLKERRSLMTYVPQTSYLFTGTIKDNISYGKDHATEEEIIEAAKSANAHDFIMKLPEGYNTQVGERGNFLSGGERQRIVIARALLKNASILLLDEPTSALDSESEQEVQKALDTLMKDRTVIVVAHRLSTIRNSDRILVLENGRVVEKDNHEELIKLNKRYAYYYNLLYA